MCTATYIPAKENGFIFTTNRDEFVQRSASSLVGERDEKGKRILFPQDPKAKGTWIAISDHNQMVCMLNGAFVRHTPEPPYRLSRGIMAKEFFSYDSAKDFYENFEFQGIEPFTMIIFDNGALHDLRWDGNKKYFQEMDASQSHIWASSALFPEEWQQKRKAWLAAYLQSNNVIDQQKMLDFHKNAGEGNPEYDLVMNRDDIVCTTSITSIVNHGSTIQMRFESLSDVKIEEAALSKANISV